MRPGFTLVELSIVLVIIGLLIGGILVGEDLIQASKIRAQISQIESIRTGALTFKLKFGALPGDLPNASSFGLTQAGGLSDMYSSEPASAGDGAIMSCHNDSLSLGTFPPYGRTGTSRG